MSTPLDRLLSAARSAVQHVRGRYQTDEPDYMDGLASALGQYEQAVRHPGYQADIEPDTVVVEPCGQDGCACERRAEPSARCPLRALQLAAGRFAGRGLRAWQLLVPRRPAVGGAAVTAPRLPAGWTREAADAVWGDWVDASCGGEDGAHGSSTLSSSHKEAAQ